MYHLSDEKISQECFKFREVKGAPHPSSISRFEREVVWLLFLRDPSWHRHFARQITTKSYAQDQI